MPFLPIDLSAKNRKKEKERLRVYFRAIRKRLSGESRCLLDSALLSNTVVLPEYRNATLLLCYYPVRGEPNILHLARHALKEGKELAFPVSDPDSCTLTFRKVTSMQQLIPGAYDIPEPDETCPAVTDFSGALCIVPALSFDRSGYRLGYGKGYYDRFLCDFPGVSLGLAYSYCLTDRLPTDSHDQPVDRIITEKGVLPDEERSI